MELTQLHLWQAQALDGDLDDDLDGGDSVYKERYERVMKELNVTRKRMEKQHEEEMEQERGLKKAVDKRVSALLYGYIFERDYLVHNLENVCLQK